MADYINIQDKHLDQIPVKDLHTLIHLKHTLVLRLSFGGIKYLCLSSLDIQPCPMILVFGCRQSEMDHIYKEETIQAKNKLVFKELYTAYSREPDKPKVQALNCP